MISTMMPKTLPALMMAALFWGTPALGHVDLVASAPADKAVVAAPSQIVMRFSGPLITRVANIRLTDSHGGTVMVTMVPGSNASELVGKIDRSLVPGVYRATWTAAGEDDGHRMSGNISFTVK